VQLHQNKGRSVIIAAVGINLVIGVLYAWSIFKEVILASIQHGGVHDFHWQAASVNDPYALCCLFFAFSMVPAGRAQDLIGPQKTAFIGAVLGSFGFLLISQSINYWVWMLGFGVFVGAGIGFAYASTTPAALKWFAPNKSNLITSVVVSGFALASLYIAPLATYLVYHRGLASTMQYFSAEFFMLVALFSYFLVAPATDFKPSGFHERRQHRNDQARHQFSQVDETSASFKQAIKDQRFWVLWLLLFIGSGVGLMVIGNIKPLARFSMGELAYIVIIVLAIGDVGGRLLAGHLTTQYGRRNILSAAFLLQTVLMFSAYIAIHSGSALYIELLAVLIGLNYGANLVIFPSYVKDFWGVKHFGLIYGMLFTAWGLGGFFMIKVTEKLTSETASSFWSFMLAGALMLIGSILTFFVDNRKDIERAMIRKEMRKRNQ